MTALEDKTASKKKDLCVDVFKAFIIFVDLTRISTKLFSSKFQVINPCLDYVLSQVQHY